MLLDFGSTLADESYVFSSFCFFVCKKECVRPLFELGMAYSTNAMERKTRLGISYKLNVTKSETLK